MRKDKYYIYYLFEFPSLRCGEGNEAALLPKVAERLCLKALSSLYVRPENKQDTEILMAGCQNDIIDVLIQDVKTNFRI
jgi:hypothetical protein